MEFYLPRCKQPTWFKYVGPILVFGLIVYGTWGFAHKLCHDKIHKRFHHKATAIGLTCTVAFLDVLLFVIWLQLAVITGPGKQPTVPPFMILPEETLSENGNDRTKINSLIPPLCYRSDPNGYPIWCSICGSVKTERVHHSSDLNYCVPRFDHRCVWLGAIIGHDNYRLFFQFLVYMAILSLIVWISICAFLRQIIHDHEGHGPHINPNLIAVLIFSALCWIMTTSMAFTHVLCIARNRTSIEVLARNDKSGSQRRILCYYSSKDDCRYVVEFRNDEFDDFWRKRNLWCNVTEFLGSKVLLWFIPMSSRGSSSNNPELEQNRGKLASLAAILGSYLERYNEETIERIEEKVSKGDFLTKFYAYGDKFA